MHVEIAGDEEYLLALDMVWLCPHFEHPQRPVLSSSAGLHSFHDEMLMS